MVRFSFPAQSFLVPVKLKEKQENLKRKRTKRKKKSIVHLSNMLSLSKSSIV